MLVIGFKLVAGAIASNAFTGVAIGVGFIFASLVYSISRNPSQRDELLRFSFIGFSLVEASGLIGYIWHIRPMKLLPPNDSFRTINFISCRYIDN